MNILIEFKNHKEKEFIKNILISKKIIHENHYYDKFINIPIGYLYKCINCNFYKINSTKKIHLLNSNLCKCFNPFYKLEAYIYDFNCFKVENNIKILNIVEKYNLNYMLL